ncbi:MAG: hypothetical protein ACO3IB_10690 [Phycisphaerales bacterium]
MARRGGPALYEILGTPKQGGAPAGGGAPIEPPSSSGRGLGFDTRGLGFFALLLGCVVVAYLIGVSRGERIGRERLAQERAEEMRLIESAKPAAAPANPTGTPRASENQMAAAGPATGSTSASAGAPQPLPPAEAGEPREKGLNYFVLISTLPANAEKIALFFRERGLDARVVSDQNDRLREVIVLPGFPGSERNSPMVQELKSRIRTVGAYWKAANGGSDFSDTYAKRFDG